MKNLTHKAVELFSKDLYATQATGAKLVEVGKQYAKSTLAIQPLHRNAMGGVMGGAMFTLADLAFAAAANSSNIEAGEPLTWVTTSSNIHFLSQPAGDNLTAVTQCVKSGKATCLYYVNIYDDRQTLVTTVAITGRKVTNPKKQQT